MKRICLLLALAAGPVLGAPREGFFRLETDRGVWWLVDPQGKRFFSRGVAQVNMGVALDRFDPAAPAYCAMRFSPSPEKWRQATLDRLKSWGFNTLGTGADDGLVAAHAMPYLVTVGIGAALGMPWADPATPEARTKIREVVGGMLKYRADPLLLGYCLDGALGWWDESILLHALRQPAAKDPVKTRLLARLQAAYRGDLRRFEEDFALEPAPKAFDDLKGAFKRAGFRPGRRPLLVEEYVEELARDFYRAATEELRRVDPNHLVFTDRLPGYVPQPVVRAAAPFVDGFAVNYDTFAAQGWAAPAVFDAITRLSRKPVLVTETYFAAEANRSGNRNRNGAYRTVRTQPERAAGAGALVRSLARQPGVIGVHWYQWADQPPAGDGEDFNLGLVDLKDQPYADLTAELAAAAPETESRHGTWPGGDGLVRSPQGLRVPALPELPIVNGELDEWPLAATWVPGAAAAAPFERFGDLHLAWHPEGLAVAVVWTDYRARQRAVDAPEPDTERLTVGVGIDNDKPVVFTLKGLQERIDPDRPELGYRTPEVLAVRGGTPFPAEGRFLSAQGTRGTTRIVELFLPAALFRRERLDAREIWRASLSLRLRANVRETFWPRPFRINTWTASDDWVPLAFAAWESGAEPAARPAATTDPAGSGTVAAAEPTATAGPAAATTASTVSGARPPVASKPGPAAKPAAKPGAKGTGKPAAGVTKKKK